MNPKISIAKILIGAGSWRSCRQMLVALALLGWCAAAHAGQADVWTGVDNLLWQTTNNWTIAVSNGDDLTFPILTGSQYRSTNDFFGLGINSITINTNGYFIASKTSTNYLAITNGITDNYGSNTISIPLFLGGSQTFANNANGVTNEQTTLTGTIYLNTNTLNIGGSGNFYLSGVISSPTNGGGMLTVNDAGNNARLSAANLFGTNGVYTTTTSTNVTYTTNTVYFTNELTYTTNGGGSTNIFTYITNNMVFSNVVFTYSTNAVVAVEDAITVSSGTLQLGNAAAIPSGATVGNLWLDGSLDLNGNSQTINGLEDSGSGSGVVDNISGANTAIYTLTLGNASSNGVFSGVIKNTSGTVGLTKTGFGTETLTGGNQYSGPTAINQGTLALSGNGALGQYSTQVQIGSGAVLDVSQTSYGYYYPYGPLTVAAGTPGKPYTNFFGSYYPFYPCTTNFVVTTTTNNYVSSNTTVTVNGSVLTTNAVYTTNFLSYTYSSNSIVNVINADVNGSFFVTGGGQISPLTSVSPGIATWTIAGNLSLDESYTPSANRVNFLLNTNTTPGGGTNDLIVVTNSLYVGDELDFVITPLHGSLANGKYTLIESANYIPHGNTGQDSDSDAANLVLIAPRGITGTFDTSSQPGNILLQASGTANPGSIIWAATNAANDTWDISLTRNWKTNGTTTPSAQFYYAEDNVTFDDTGFGVVTLPVVQAPGSLTFNNNNTNYTFNANAATFIAGPSGVTLNGKGSVTFNNPNSFTGDTVINQGTLILGAYAAYNEMLLYNGVAPGNLVFGGLGSATLEPNEGLANVSQNAVFNNLVLNSGANAAINSNGRGANDIGSIAFNGTVTRNVGSTLYVAYTTKNPSANNGVYFTNTVPWSNGLLGGGYMHVGNDWFAAQTNYNNGNNLVVQNYLGYSNGAPFSATVWMPTNNIVISNNVATVVTASSIINTLKLSDPALLTLNSGVVLTDATGGLLISSSGSGASTLTGGTIMGAAGQDLIVIQNNTASPFTIGSVIANNGSPTALTLGGLGGTLILTNTETYSGATYLNAGTLQVGSGAAGLGDIHTTSAIYDNGTLAFNRPDSTTVNGAVSGTGSLSQNGTGVLNLTANNTLQGLVTINSGVLQLGNGGAAGSISNAAGVVDSSMLIISNSSVMSVPAVISGAGVLVNAGSGSFVIVTNETYTGTTVVSNGTIVVAAAGTISNTTAIVVNAGGTLDVSAAGLTLRSTYPGEVLAGNGAINGALTTASGSLLTPGTNGVFGTLTFNNNLNLNGGKYYFDVTNTVNDHVFVGGIVNQGGGVAIINCPTNLANGIYNLVYATNGVSGSAANIAVYAPQLPLGQLAVVTNSTAHTVDLLVFSGYATTVTWLGDGGNNYWDTSSNSKWQNSLLYASADDVIFDDSGNGSVPVNLDVGSVYPSVITVNSTNVNYTLGAGTPTVAANIISGGAEIIKNGTGTLTIQNVNDYLGGTVINGGTIVLGNNTAASADGMIGSSFVTNSGALIGNNFTNETVFGPIINGPTAGSLTQQGAGKLILAGNNSGFTGPVTIATNSALQIGNGTSGSIMSTPVLTNNGTLVVDVSGSQTIVNDIIGGGSYSNLLGTILLSGTNSYAGATAVNGGELDIASTNALPPTTSLILNDNASGVANSAGILDLHGNNLTVASLSGGNTGNGTAGLEEGLVYNNDATTTNILTINGGTTNTYNGQLLDNVTSGTSKLGLAILGSSLTLVVPVNSGNAIVYPNTFSGGVTLSNATLALGAVVSTTPSLEGSDAIGGSPLGTQNILATGTNDTFFAADSGGSTGPTIATAVGTLTVATNAFLYINGPQRGAFTSTALVGGNCTLLYQPEYVRDQVSFGNASAYNGTVIFAGNGGGGNAGGGFVYQLAAGGLPNANVVLGITNNQPLSIAGNGGLFPLGTLSGGDNSATIGAASQGNGTSNGAGNTVWVVGNLSINATNVVGAQITDAGCGVRMNGAGVLILTNNILSYGGQTCVSNGILSFAPLGNNPVLGFTPLTNNFLVCSNFTVVAPGILDVTHIGGTLYVGVNTASQSLFGNGTINGSVLVTNNLIAPASRVGPNAGSFPGNLTVTNNMTVNFGSTIQMNISATNSTPYSSVTAGGTLTINSARLTVLANDSAPFANQSSNVFYFFDSPAGVHHVVTANTIGSTGTVGITNISLPVVANSYWVTNLALDGSMALVDTNRDSNPLLSSLVVSPAGALTPAFSSNTLSYTAVEAYLNSPITVTPTLMDATATNQVIYLGATQLVASGSASTSLTLNSNPRVANTVTVLVTAQDGVHFTNYTVNVVRNPARTAPLLAPVINGNTLTMSWPLSENGYQVQAQTNALGIGLSNNWVTVAGSSLTNSISIIIDSNQPSVFYQLINTNSP